MMLSTARSIEWRASNLLRDLVEIGSLSLLFALQVLVVHKYGLENWAFVVTLFLACVFFPIHHYVPFKYKLPFFVLISFLAICTAIGTTNAIWLISLGSVFILLAHAPIRFRYRVLLMIGYFVIIAAFRAKLLPSGISGAVWPILGSMFIFRIIIYMYELKNKTSEFSVSRSLAYFFMMPNANFTLLPVIDYKNLYSAYYPQNVPPIEIYEKGISLLLKGTIHLLLYRLVYQNVLIDPATVADASDATQYLVGTFLLYLRISGYFHMISGILHMYGFNLPETHHLYFLASSFTDFWRRINIFWKDFMQKIFFYPVQFYLTRKSGKYTAVVVATIFTFFITWFLHAYQWFWIRGEFKFSLQDAIFWGSLGVVVLINMLLEMIFPKKRTLKKKKKGISDHFILALKTVLTFSSIVVIWNVWSTPDFAELKKVFQSYSNFGIKDLVFIGSIILCIGLLAIVYGDRQRGDSNLFKGANSSLRGESAFWRNSAIVFVSLVSLLYINYFSRTLPLPASLKDIVHRATSPVLNDRDQKLLQNGYYEDLTNASRFSPELQALYVSKPRDWTRSSVHVRDYNKFPSLNFKPSSDSEFKNGFLEINSLGFRDQEYPKVPEAGVFRVGLAGASHSLGVGVDNHEVYEALVEDRINEMLRKEGRNTKLEIINMSMGGHGAIYKIATIEKRGLELDLDAILYIAIDEYLRLPVEIARHLTREDNLFYFDDVKEYAENLGVKPGVDKKEAELMVTPDSLPDFTQMLYRHLQELSNKNGVELWYGFIPIPEEITSKVEDGVQTQISIAKNMGIHTFDIRDTYADIDDLSTLWVAPWDTHPVAAGHELIAQRMYDELWPLVLEAIDNADTTK